MFESYLSIAEKSEGPLRIKLICRCSQRRLGRVILALLVLSPLPAAAVLRYRALPPEIAAIQQQLERAWSRVLERVDSLPIPSVVHELARRLETQRRESGVFSGAHVAEASSPTPRVVVLEPARPAFRRSLAQESKTEDQTANYISVAGQIREQALRDAVPVIELPGATVTVREDGAVVAYLDAAQTEPAPEGGILYASAQTGAVTRDSTADSGYERQTGVAPPERSTATRRQSQEPARTSRPSRARSTNQERSQAPWTGADFLDRGFAQANALLERIPGLLLESVTFTQGYSSNGIPSLRGVPSAASQLGYDLDFGASAVFGWRHIGRRKMFSLVYEPSVIRRSQFKEWNSTDHNLRLLSDSKLSPRWDLRLSARGAAQTLEQFFFDPPELRRIQDAPATLEELSNAVAAGELTDEEVAAILTGAPVVDRPAQAVLDAQRVMTLGARVATTYAPSRRLKLKLGMEALRSKTISGAREQDSVSGRIFLPSTASARAEAGFSYDLSPESSVGIEVSRRRTESSLRHANYTNAVANFEKRWGRGWSVGVQGGAGAVEGDVSGVLLGDAVSQSAMKPSWIAGGTLSYRGRDHSFAVSSTRNTGDNLGIGSQSSLSTEAEWTWSRPGAPWGVFVGGNLYKADLLGGRTTLESRQGRAGLVRRAGRHGSIVTEYGYGSVASPFTGVLSNLSRHRVQVSFVWRPGERR